MARAIKNGQRLGHQSLGGLGPKCQPFVVLEVGKLRSYRNIDEFAR